MRKKSESTIIERALDCVPGFGRVFQKLQLQVVFRGQNKSTLHIYTRRVAAISLHFGKLPEQIDDDEINEYLTSLILKPKSPSWSNFKHAVYGLLYYYRLLGQNKRGTGKIRKTLKLPGNITLEWQESGKKHVPRLCPLGNDGLFGP